MYMCVWVSEWVSEREMRCMHVMMVIACRYRSGCMWMFILWHLHSCINIALGGDWDANLQLHICLSLDFRLIWGLQIHSSQTTTEQQNMFCNVLEWLNARARSLCLVSVNSSQFQSSVWCDTWAYTNLYLHTSFDSFFRHINPCLHVHPRLHAHP